MLIDGKWVTQGNGFDVVNPATGEQIDTVADATADDAVRAITVAEHTFPEWSATTAYHRASILQLSLIHI